MSSSIAIAHKRPVEKPRKDSSPKHYTLDTYTSRLRVKETKKEDSQPAWSSLRHRARSQSPGRAMASLSLLKSTLKVQDVLGEAL
jgi:hypothetical protein